MIILKYMNNDTQSYSNFSQNMYINVHSQQSVLEFCVLHLPTSLFLFQRPIAPKPLIITFSTENARAFKNQVSGIFMSLILMSLFSSSKTELQTILIIPISRRLGKIWNYLFYKCLRKLPPKPGISG